MSGDRERGSYVYTKYFLKTPEAEKRWACKISEKMGMNKLPKVTEKQIKRHKTRFGMLFQRRSCKILRKPDKESGVTNMRSLSSTYMKSIGQVPGEVAVLVYYALWQLQEPVGGVWSPPVLQIAILIIVTTYSKRPNARKDDCLDLINMRRKGISCHCFSTLVLNPTSEI